MIIRETLSYPKDFASNALDDTSFDDRKPAIEMSDQHYTTSPPPAYSDIYNTGPFVQPPSYTDASDQLPTYSSTELSSLADTDRIVQQEAVMVQVSNAPNPACKEVQNNPPSADMIYCCSSFLESFCDLCCACACCICFIVSECNN